MAHSFTVKQHSGTPKPQEALKIGLQCGHVWLTSYPGPRGFSCLFAALVLSSHAEKNQENPQGPGYLNNWDITYPKEFYMSAFKRHYITENKCFTFNILNKPFFLPQREIIWFQNCKLFQETCINADKVKRD